VTESLSTPGRHLWASLLAQDESLGSESHPMRATALEACRTKDRCDRLDEVCRAEPPMLDNGKGLPIAHPAWVEARQQAITLTRLLTALRLPDEATGKRPQVRSARGAYKTGGKSTRDRLKAV
jgi:hypothetical protein